MFARAEIPEGAGEFDALHTLKAKSFALLGIMLAFLLIAAVLLARDRARMLDDVARLGTLHGSLESLVKKGLFDADAVPGFGAAKVSVGAAHEASPADPARQNKVVASNGLATVISELGRSRAGIEEDLRRHADAGFGMFMLMGMLALGTLGAVVFGFMGRLSADARRMIERARALGDGGNAPRSCVDRQDELGALARALDSIGTAWGTRSAREECGLRRELHRDKIDALSTLAQRMAHEIGNPLAGIVGMAQAIQEAKCANACRSNGQNCHPDVIIDQAERIARTSRQFSGWSDLRRAERGPLDLNALVDRTCGLVAFDRRFAGIQLRMSLDPDLPALHAVADDLVLVLTWFLYDAAERADRSAGSASCWVEVATVSDAGWIVVEVSDNARQRACHAASCARGSSHAQGGARWLCRSLMDEMGGQVVFTCDAGINCARMRLPVKVAVETGERR